MNVVPAQVAGVTEVALASPPQREHGGRVHPMILAAARLLGVDEVYAMGGAGAIGAFAHGVAELGLDPVDVVTGPGNNYVASAKRAVAGLVGTDSEAGATEILIVADAERRPAARSPSTSISQAEHDEQASAVLVTDSEPLAAGRRRRDRAARGRHAPRRARRAALAGPQSAIVLVDDLARRDGVQQRLRARAPRAAPRRSAAGGVRPRRRRLRRARLAGEPRRLPRRQQPRPARPADRRATAPGSRPRRSCVRSR